MTRVHFANLARLVVPQRHCGIRVAREEEITVGGEGCAGYADGTVLAVDGAQTVARVRVPDAAHAIKRGRGQQRPVAAKLHTGDGLRVRVELAHTGARGDVPEDRSFVHGPRGQQVAARAECHAHHIVGVRLE